jgi:class 3 adenylate cyclase/Tfp pilus assembly protein PilF
MKNFFFCSIGLLLFITSSFVLSQSDRASRIDTLLSELSKSKNDTNRVELLGTISFEYSYVNPNLGLDYGKRGVELAKKIAWDKGLANALNSIGSNYSSLYKHLESVKYYKKSLAIYERLNDKEGMGEPLNNLGISYLEQSKYPIALKYFFRCLKLYDQLGKKKNKAHSLNNIGVIYFNTFDFPKALKFFKQYLSIAKELDNQEMQAQAMMNIGNAYSNLSKPQEALEYYKKSLKLFETVGNMPQVAINLMNLGWLYSEQADYTTSLEYLERALKLSESLGDKPSVSYTLLCISEAYWLMYKDTNSHKTPELTANIALNRQSNLNLSIENAIEAKRVSEEVGNLNNSSSAYSALYRGYKEKGELGKALSNYEKYVELKDSIYSKENRDKIAALEKARETDVNRIKIAKQKVQIEAQKTEQSFIIYSFIGILLFILTVLGLVFYQRKKADKLLYNVLPISIAKRLKKKEHPISDYFPLASIIFIDIVGFTSLSKETDPQVIVTILNKIFTHYDTIADKYGIEKIKTIGDAYMATAGIPVAQSDNPIRAARMAIEVQELMSEYKTDDGIKIEVRIGLDCGPVVAGVIGEKKFIYDMWSDAVNTASRMESMGKAGEIHISERFKEAINEVEEFDFEERGEMTVKGKGKMKTYFLKHRKSSRAVEGVTVQ